jgi:hypothetical protein
MHLQAQDEALKLVPFSQIADAGIVVIFKAQDAMTADPFGDLLSLSLISENKIYNTAPKSVLPDFGQAFLAYVIGRTKLLMKLIGGDADKCGRFQLWRRRGLWWLDRFRRRRDNLARVISDDVSDASGLSAMMTTGLAVSVLSPVSAVISLCARSGRVSTSYSLRSGVSSGATGARSSSGVFWAGWHPAARNVRPMASAIVREEYADINASCPMKPVTDGFSP